MKYPASRLLTFPAATCTCPMAVLIFTLTVGSAGDAGAQVRKEDNTDTLDQTTSWVGAAVPQANDIAQWDNQLTGPNFSDLGAVSSSWQGIKVLDPAGAATITGTTPINLTVGASGIDLGTATQNLTISSPLVLGGAQTWSVASGRFLTITTPGAAAASGTGPLTIQGPGGVRLGGLVATYTWTGGMVLTGGTGLKDVTALPGGTALINAANLVFDMQSIATLTNSGLTLNTPALTGAGGTVHTIGGARSSSGTPAWVQSSSLTLASGNTNFTQTRGSSARTINQFSSITRAAGATANFRDPLNSNGSNNANTGGYRTNNAANVNGIVPFTTFTTSSSNTSFFAASGTGNGTSNNGAAYSAFTASTVDGLGTSTQNSNVVTDVAIAASATINSIRFSGATPFTITIDPAATLTVGAGAMLVTPASSVDHIITGGKLSGGNPGSGSDKDLIVHQHSNSAGLIIDSEIVDYSEPIEGGSEFILFPTALTKTGAGKLVIGGTGSHTGNTFVNAGTLLVNGALNGSPEVTVHLGGTLGGTGTVVAPVAVSGILAPGASIGTLATGAVTFNAGATLAVEINTTNSTSDKLVVTGGISTGGSRVNLTLADLGFELPLANGTKFTLVDYTTSWPGTDLLTYGGNAVADNSTITFGSNKFLVNYSDAAVDGTALTLTVVDAVTPTAYQAWINSYAAQIPLAINRLPEADPDGDGRTNLLEFALDGNPASGSDNGKMVVSTDDSNDVGTDRDLSVTLAVRDGAVLGAGPDGSVTLTVEGMVYTIQGSDTLLTWDKAVNEVNPASPLVPAPGTGWTARTFQVTDSNGLPDKRFIRVGVQ